MSSLQELDVLRDIADLSFSTDLSIDLVKLARATVLFCQHQTEFDSNIHVISDAPVAASAPVRSSLSVFGLLLVPQLVCVPSAFAMRRPCDLSYFYL